MTKLEKLIKELCPDGVEYRELKDIADMKRGTSVTKKDITEGNIPVISGGREPAYYCDKYNRDGETITVAGSGAGAGYVQYWTKPIFVCDAFSVKGLEFIQTKYLYYCLANMQEDIYSTKKGSGVPHVHISCIENFKIPTPPIEVQREIVRILDNFTELTAELNEKLTAELTTRNKQYEYYRDSVLTFGDAVPTVKLKDVCISVKDGMHNLPKNSTEKGEFPILSAANINNGTVDYNAKRYVDEEVFNVENKRTNVEIGDVLLTIVATIGRTAVVNSNPNFLLQRSVCVLKVNKKILPGFLKYCLDTQKNQRNMIANAHGAAQAGLYLNQVAEIEIPLPPLEEQERIVEILDRFDKLCNDISASLPAEIETRQKQYEYYREKLLTFKELKV